MKQAISVLSVCLLLFSLAGMAACSGQGRDPAAQYLGGSERFFLTADKETVAPGETVTVTLHAENGKNVACFDMLLTTPDNAALTGYKEKQSGDFVTTAAPSGSDVVFSAIIATRGDIDALEMMTATYTVSEDARPGDTVTFEAAFGTYLIGVDDRGDETVDVTSLVSVSGVSVNVAQN